MKKFCISLIFVLSAVFITDRLIGQLLHNNMKYARDTRLVKLYYETTDLSEDVVCIGTSRCEHHYVSSIIADSLNCTVYNSGWSNSRIYAYVYLLHQILAVHTPKLICLDVKPTDYLYESADEAYASVLHYAPCFGRDPKADSIFIESGDYVPFMLSSIYRYNTNMPDYMDVLFHPVPYQPKSNGGYKPTPTSANGGHLRDIVTLGINRPYDSRKIHYLEQFIQLCQKHRIALIFSVSPSYSYASRDLYEVPKTIAQRYGVPVFDYHSEGLFLERPEYFKDHQHLLDEGARVFTSIFAHDLKVYLESLEHNPLLEH